MKENNSKTITFSSDEINFLCDTLEFAHDSLSDYLEELKKGSLKNCVIRSMLNDLEDLYNKVIEG